jgi:hypothetical protein
MSDSDHPTTNIIKSDRTGRTRYTRQYKITKARNNQKTTCSLMAAEPPNLRFTPTSTPTTFARSTPAATRTASSRHRKTATAISLPKKAPKR